MPDPIPFPGQQLPPELDMSDPVVRFITGILQIVETKQSLEWDLLKGEIVALLQQEPAPPVPAGADVRACAKEMVDAAYDLEDGAGQVIDALRLDPACTEAWIYLAQDCGQELELAVLLFTIGLLCAREAVGGEAGFEKYRGRFWVEEATQPFMLALEGLAVSTYTMGDVGTASMHYGLMLELNPEDHQGARYPLLAILLLLGQSKEAGELLDIYTQDETGAWKWAAPLAAFQQQGASPRATLLLEAARKAFPEVEGYITGTTPLPEQPPTTEREQEVLTTAMLLAAAWHETEGALAWMKSSAPEVTPPLFVPPVKEKRSGPRSLD